MFFDYFAGSIFTSQEVFLFYAIALLVLATVAGMAIFFGKKLLRRSAKQGQGNNSELPKSILIGFAIVAAAILIFIVTPAKVKDARWERKQQECARQVGYASPADENSDTATAESQSEYGQCLGL